MTKSNSKNKYKPYEHWTLDEIWHHLEKQCDAYGFDKEEVKSAVYDDRWYPPDDFNGCTMVQDPLHPYLPCFMHDYRWVVLDGGIETDRQFVEDNRQAGKISEAKIKRWFLGVRVGWIFWHKWVKLIKNKLTL